VLAQREGIAFVQLVCFTCQTQTLALVTGAPDPAVDDADGSEPARPDLEPISEADVLEMQSFLAGYKGDIRGLFQAGREDGDDRTDEPE
jgi:hypothetical protein